MSMSIFWLVLLLGLGVLGVVSQVVANRHKIKEIELDKEKAQIIKKYGYPPTYCDVLGNSMREIEIDEED